MNRKRTLGVLLLLLLMSLLYGYWQMPRQERVGPKVKAKVAAPLPKSTTTATPGKTPSKTPAKITQSGEFPRMRTDLLDRHLETYSGVRRDLFYSSIPVPEVVAPPVVLQPKPVVEPPPPIEPTPEPVPTPAQVVTRELARFKFLGFVQKEGQKTIFLSFEGENLLVHPGDRFGRDREFLVTALTATELKIRQEEVGEIVIPLIDQEALSPSSIGTAPTSLFRNSQAPPVRSPAQLEQISPPNPLGSSSGRAPMPLRRSRFPGGTVENQPNEGTQDEEE